MRTGWLMALAALAWLMLPTRIEAQSERETNDDGALVDETEGAADEPAVGEADDELAAVLAADEPSTATDPSPAPASVEASAPAVAEAPSGVPLTVTIGAQLFGEYAVDLLDEEVGGDRVFHQFELGRAWLWAGFEIEGARGRVLFEGARAAEPGALVGVAGDSLVARFREAWAGYRAWDAVEIRGGIVPTLTAPTLTGLWGLRAVARTPNRRFDLLDAADLGATLTGDLPGGWGTLGVGVYNGEGYEARERNRGKNIEAYARLHPLAMVEGAEPLTVVAAYVDGSAGAGGAATDRLVAAVAWDRERFGAGAATTWIRGFADDGDREGLLAEGWARTNPWRGLLIGARYTWLDRDRDANDQRLHELTATVGYRVANLVTGYLAVDGRFGDGGIQALDPTYDRWRIRLVVEGRFEAPFDVRLGSDGSEGDGR